MKRLKKIIFMGTPTFAVPALEKLYLEHIVPGIIVTQPDKPKGRGRKLQMPAVKKWALDKNIPIIQPESLKSATLFQRFTDYAPDIIITAAYGKLLGKRLLQLPTYGCINIHPSLLPLYRGPSPIRWALLHGDTVTGVSLFSLVPEMDAGDILSQVKCEIFPDDTYGQLHDRLSFCAAEELYKTLRAIDTDVIIPQPQDHSRATYSQLVTRDLLKINWNESANEIVNLIRAMSPTPAAFTHIHETEIKILTASVMTNMQGIPGTIAEIRRHRGIVVYAGTDAVMITRVKPQAKQEMPAFAYANGARVAIGDYCK